MHLNLPLRDDMREAIIEGRKTCTTRTRRHGNVGDTFSVKTPSGTAACRLTHVFSRLLRDAINKYYFYEGFTTPHEFVTAWDETHPKAPYEPDMIVCIHRFEIYRIYRHNA